MSLPVKSNTLSIPMVGNCFATRKAWNVTSLGLVVEYKLYIF
jgi:hypothetical protein